MAVRLVGGGGFPKGQFPLDAATLLERKFAGLDVWQAFINEQRRKRVPPGVEFFPEIGHHLGVLCGNIPCLTSVGDDVVELVVVH
jgi:hypothetical protein